MKMTKRFEKKLKAFAKRHNLDTNFNWDIGWFDFLIGHIKIGSVRFVGYNLCEDKPKLRYDIYLATMYTRICYRGTHTEYPFVGALTGIQKNQIKSDHKEGDIWSLEDGTYIDYISEEHSKTATIYTKDIEHETEDSIIAFFEDALKRLLNAKTLYKMEEKLQDLEKDFRGN